MIPQMLKEKFVEEKIMMVLYVIGFFIALNTLLVFSLHYKNLFLKEVEGLSFDASKRDFCAMAISQIIAKKLSPDLMENDLYTQVTADKYKAMYFERDDVVRSVYSGESLCKVLVKTNAGLRSFDLFLENSGDFKFFYQIKKIREHELFEDQSSNEEKE